jgi:hypothetical protein|tara:strand:+ start:601 stop:885 length:285 start_codon:yes stop_codon:yes gene_type:complete
MTDNANILKTVTLANGAKITFEDPDKWTPPTDAVKKADTESTARSWRDFQLKESDWIIPLTDHPQNAAYVTYRKALRDWPSTADFPDKKPTLGS